MTFVDGEVKYALVVPLKKTEWLFIVVALNWQEFTLRLDGLVYVREWLYAIVAELAELVLVDPPPKIA